MRRKRVAVGVATGVLVACAVLYSLRFYQLNSSYPQQQDIGFDLGQPASYGGQNSDGGTQPYGALSVTATRARLVDYEDVKTEVPGYDDPVLALRQAHDMKALILDVKIDNVSDAPQKAYLRDFKLQSRAWTNGLDVDLFLALNGGRSTIAQLAPGEEESFTLPFVMYDMQFNNEGDWSQVSERPFCLVMALYPDKYRIDLGSVAQ